MNRNTVCRSGCFANASLVVLLLGAGCTSRVDLAQRASPAEPVDATAGVGGGSSAGGTGGSGGSEATLEDASTGFSCPSSCTPVTIRARTDLAGTPIPVEPGAEAYECVGYHVTWPSGGSGGSGGLGGSGGSGGAPSCGSKTICYDVCTCLGTDGATCVSRCGSNSCANKTSCYDLCVCTGTAASTCVSRCQTSAICGNGMIEAGEVCDGNNLGGFNCDTATAGARPVGTLACSSACTFNLTMCSDPGPVQIVAFSPLIDNSLILHGFELFQASTPQVNGSYASCIDAPPEGVRVYHWAPGTGPLVLPPGSEIPLDTWDAVLAVHYINVTDRIQSDTSGVSACVCPI